MDFTDFVTISDSVSYSYEPELDELEEGFHTVSVTVTDHIGNTYTASRTYEFIDVTENIFLDYTGLSAEDVINTFIDQYKLNEQNFACFYYNTQTCEESIYNGETVFYGASTVKVPLCMVYYDLLMQEALDEDDTLLYSYSHYEDGNGDTTSVYSAGSYVPISYLIEQTIVYSDNTAKNILIDGIGYSEYRSLIAEYTMEELDSTFYTDNIITANYLYDVLTHLYSNTDAYVTILDYMLQATPGQYLQLNCDAYPIAHKYGWYNDNIHDYGIIYSPQPYLIGIFTKDRDDGEILISNLNQWMLGYTLYGLNKS